MIDRYQQHQKLLNLDIPKEQREVLRPETIMSEQHHEKKSEIKKTERGKKVAASGAEKHVIYVYLNPLNFPEEISLVGEAGNG